MSKENDWENHIESNEVSMPLFEIKDSERYELLKYMTSALFDAIKSRKGGDFSSEGMSLVISIRNENERIK
ncbi:MAG: hypothetical protein WCR33_01190 [Bacilli bacterium]